MKFAIIDVRNQKILVTSESYDLLDELKQKWFRTPWQNCHKIVPMREKQYGLCS